MTENIKFEKISGSERQKKILFRLLKQRKYKISHLQTPDIRSHNNFVENHPYRAWFIVFDKKEEIGTFYIKFDNSIGINLLIQTKENIEFILSFIKSNYLPQNEVASLIPSYFYLNISSDNFQLQGILDEMEITKLQVSYKI